MLDSDMITLRNMVSTLEEKLYNDRMQIQDLAQAAELSPVEALRYE